MQKAVAVRPLAIIHMQKVVVVVISAPQLTAKPLMPRELEHGRGAKEATQKERIHQRPKTMPTQKARARLLVVWQVIPRERER
jgi:hypothetical protein